MSKNQEILNKLEQEKNVLLERIDKKKRYNAKSFLISTVVKSGIALDCCLPFIIAAMMMLPNRQKNEDIPFIKDNKTQYVNTKVTLTSTGKQINKTSFDNNYNDEEEFAHSTAWKLNEKGKFERIITFYKYKEVKNHNLENLLTASKEEIEQLFPVTEVKKIQKDNLEEEDKLFLEDTILITKVEKNEGISRKVPESTASNVLTSIGFLANMWNIGRIVRFGKNIIVKEKYRNKLYGIREKYRPINNDELETLKDVLALREENLSLLREQPVQTVTNEKEAIITRPQRKIKAVSRG